MQSIVVYGGTFELRLKCLEDLLNDVHLEVTDKMVVGIGGGSSVISIDQVRESIRFLSVKPVKGYSKVVVFQYGEAMTVEAQNALLKTLEEPPMYAMIVISVQDKGFLLDTILSRCKSVYCSAKTNEIAFDKNLYNEIENVCSSDIGARIDWVHEKKMLLKDRSYLNDVFIALEFYLRNRLLAFNDVGVVKETMNRLFLLKGSILNENASATLGLESFLCNLDS